MAIVPVRSRIISFLLFVTASALLSTACEKRSDRIDSSNRNDQVERKETTRREINVRLDEDAVVKHGVSKIEVTEVVLEYIRTHPDLSLEELSGLQVPTRDGRTVALREIATISVVPAQ